MLLQLGKVLWSAFYVFFFISSSSSSLCCCFVLLVFTSLHVFLFTSCFFILGTFHRISLGQPFVRFFLYVILSLVIIVICSWLICLHISADRVQLNLLGDWASAQMLNGDAFDVDCSRSDVGCDKCLFSSSLYSRYREMTLNRRIFPHFNRFIHNGKVV